MTEFKAYVFDLDGTLVKIKEGYPYFITKKALNACGITKLSRENAESFWFCPVNRDIFVKEVFKICPVVFWNEFNKADKAHFQECIRTNTPYAYAYPDINVLKTLKENGIRLGLVTVTANYTLKYKLNIIEKSWGIKFDSVVGTDRRNVKEKPEPDSLQICLKELGVTNNEACYVDDLVVGIQMAQRADVFDVLIDRGNAKLPEHTKPKRTIKSLTELINN